MTASDAPAGLRDIIIEVVGGYFDVDEEDRHDAWPYSALCDELEEALASLLPPSSAQAGEKLTRLHDFYGGFDVILPSAKRPTTS